MRELPTGIARTATGFRAWRWVVDRDHPKGGYNKSKRFPRAATLATMLQWRDDARATPTATPVLTETGFAADAATYLEAVQAMPTYPERIKQIAEWIAIFGDEPRSAVTPARIRAARDRWLMVGPKRVLEKVVGKKAAWVDRPIPLSASTVNHRLRALENLFTVLDGRRAYNPVREVPEAEPPDEAPRAVPYEVIRAILAAMPERTKPEKGGTRVGESKTKARLAVMAYTGLSHGQLMRVTREDVDLKARTLYLRPRHKGRAGRSRQGVTVPLLPQAVTAWRRFASIDCWGPFSASSMRQSFRRACAALKLDPIPRVYDIRHSFGSLAYQSTGDLRATGVLLGHRDPRTTMRYTMAAVDPRLRLALKGMNLTGGEVSPSKRGVKGRRGKGERTKKPRKDGAPGKI